MTVLALFTVAATISAYWLCVLVMVSRSWLKFRTPAGAVPKTRLERWLWLIWVPNTAAWVALPWIAWDALLDGEPEGILVRLGLVPTVLRWAAAMLAVPAFALTVRCWLAMGSSWSMAITPRKQTELLTRGPFGLVRHPIYALSLMLMTCTMVAVANLPTLIVGAIHIALIVTKAAGEERFLLRLHGPTYAEYCRSTSKFLPGRSLLNRSGRSRAA
jgi:protein-S-isoprenylcysteine O-methyltransferase Ste14